MLTCRDIHEVSNCYLSPTEQHFIDAVLGNDPIAVRSLLKYPQIDPAIYGNSAIMHSSELGQTEIVKILLDDSRVDPSVLDNYCIEWAAFRGHTDVVRLLLQDPRVDPTIKNNRPLQWARYNGNWGVVRVLQQDPRVPKNRCRCCSIM